MSAPDRDEPQPRLLNIEAAARYLGGLSIWTIRAFVADGHLHPVRLPACHRKGVNGRRLLFDLQDLNRLIDERRRA